MSSRLLAKLREALAGDSPEESGVIFESDSQHHHITIRDEAGRRTMYFGPTGEEAETAIDLTDPDSAVFEYPGMMLAALPLGPAGRRIALIGLGGGLLPGLFQRHLPDYELTVVELDPLVAELAGIYFGFAPGGRVRLVIGDGRDFLDGQMEGAFDQIWLDAFSGDYVPQQLTGLTFLKVCRRCLAPGGLLVQNLHQSRSQVFHRQLQTTLAVWGEFLAFDGQRSGNAIVISKMPGGQPGPVWKKSALKAAASRFGRRVGPYDLVEEMGKIKKFIPEPGTRVIE
ncbi:MAG: fused MFS/spermidine synthase [Candidatus Adiutrix sp.]|jgi:spermidine synthase|nr:fused MFS/spermidine synthase [Candidatus Adiutrix sp.]